MKEGWPNKETGKKSEPRINFTHLQSLQDVLPDFAKKLTIQLPVEELKEQIKDYLINKSVSIFDLGPYQNKSVDYPDYAKKLAKRIT